VGRDDNVFFCYRLTRVVQDKGSLNGLMLLLQGEGVPRQGRCIFSTACRLLTHVTHSGITKCRVVVLQSRAALSESDVKICIYVFGFLVHGQVTIIFVVSVGLSVCLFVQSFSQPSLIRFESN